MVYTAYPSGCQAPTGKLIIHDVNFWSPPFTFSLDSINFSTDTIIESLPIGEDFLYVKNTNNEVFKQWYYIDTTEIPFAYAYIEDQYCTFNPGKIEIDVIQGTPPFTYYLDSVKISSPIIDPISEGFYLIQVEDSNGCFHNKNVRIKNLCITIAEAFSPNGDGMNDTWRIDNLNLYNNCLVRVFNRHGQMVYYSEGYQQEWDGTSFGLSLPIGPYFYLIFVDKNEKTKDVYTGSVAIMR